MLQRIPGYDAQRSDRFLDPLFRTVEPTGDDWKSEVFAEKANGVLKRLAKQLAHAAELMPDQRQLFVNDSFLSTALRPENKLQPVYADDLLTVLRVVNRDTQVLQTRKASNEFRRLLRPIASAADRHIHFKVVRVEEIESEYPRTRVIYTAAGQIARRSVQQNAHWNVTWQVGETDPQIKSIEVVRFEEIVATTPGPHEKLFADCTATVFRDSQSFRQQLMRGIDYWRGRLEANYGVDPNGNQGIAIGDANGDGLDDLFVCQQGGLPNRLYVQNGDGTLRDVSAQAGVDWMEVCRSALFVDLDNDGDQDLVMAQGWYLMIMRNDGTGRFRVAWEQRSSANLYSISAADYDLDGDLDLFFCGRNPSREQQAPEGILGTPIPYHDANNGGPNILLRNDGAAGFREVTAEMGMDVNNRRYSYAASWEDFDNDGDPDLYVANDFGRNNLYRNDLKNDGRRRFHDVAADQHVEDISAGMSITWGDYNQDGRMDAYVSNMFSSAGNRITYQRRFRADSIDRSNYQRHARGNSLFENRGDGFDDVSEAMAVTMGRWAWGAKFCDLNNDGWEDLYVANGFITTEDTGDL